MNRMHIALAVLGLGASLCPATLLAQRTAKKATVTAAGSTFFAGEIVSAISSKCLDVKDENVQDGAVVQQWSCARLPHQLWNVILIDQGREEYSIVSQASKKALDVSGPSSEDGAMVVQNAFTNVDNQRWRLEKTPVGNYRIVNVRTRKCLDVQEGKRDDGTKIQQWSCSGESNQMWLLRK